MILSYLKILIKALDNNRFKAFIMCCLFIDKLIYQQHNKIIIITYIDVYEVSEKVV
jgi:hypothetical protein